MIVNHTPGQTSTIHMDWYQGRIKQESSLEIAMTLTSLSRAQESNPPRGPMSLSYILAGPEESSAIGSEPQESAVWNSLPGSSSYLVHDERPLDDAWQHLPSLPSVHMSRQETAFRLPPIQLGPPETGNQQLHSHERPTQAHWNMEESAEKSPLSQISRSHGQQRLPQPLYQSHISRSRVRSPQLLFQRHSGQAQTGSSQHLTIRKKPRQNSSISSDSSEVSSSSPSPTISSSSPRSSYRSSSPTHKTRRVSKTSHIPHSNKAYPVEQVDWIRYHHDDCNMSWAPMFQNFRRIYPVDHRTADQCLSSRYYRDNMVPMVDDEGNLIFDGRGKLKWLPAKVRDRSTPKGRALCIPYKLVDKHPERALLYHFVSEEDKEKARQIMVGNDPTDPEGKKARWRRIMREAELAGHMPPTN